MSTTCKVQPASTCCEYCNAIIRILSCYRYRSLDPQGFIVAVQRDSGLVLGMCAACLASPHTLYVGLYAVRKTYQSFGIGKAMWKEVMSHVGERNAGLYSVPRLISVYRDKAGFKVQDGYSMVIFMGNCPANNFLKSTSGTTDALLEEVDGRNASSVLLQQIIKYDAQVNHFERSQLIPLLVREEDTISVVALSEDKQQVLGFGIMRVDCVFHLMPGPVYADSPELAVNILTRLFSLSRERDLVGQAMNKPHCRAVQDGPEKEIEVLFMTTDANEEAVSVAQKLGFRLESTDPRLFTRFAPRADFHKIFCISSPDFTPF